MVRARKNLKSRRKKVTRRVRKPIRPELRTMRTESIRDAWDSSKTMDQNYSKLKLIGRGDLNRIAPGKRIEDREETETKGHIFEAETKRECRKLRRKHHVSKGEADYLRRLIKKYDDDYTAMFRDIKLNYKQYTKNHLRRRCTRLKLDDEDLKTSGRVRAGEEETEE
jgi:hypothetical protein